MGMGRKNQDSIAGHVSNLDTFDIGNVKAGWAKYTVATDRLPREWADDLRRCFNEARDIDGSVYVVFSYSTPMAWYWAPDGWTFPEVKYSPTTTQHQHYIRNGIGWDQDITTLNARTTPLLSSEGLPYSKAWS